MPSRNSISRVCIAMLVSFAFLAMPATVTAAWPGSNGRIVYRALEPGYEAEGQEAAGLAWTSGRPGKAPHPLTRDPSDADPQVSPDGRTIVFSRSVEQGSGFQTAVFVIRFDRSGLRLLTDPPEHCSDGKATFDPQGDRLFFVRHCRAPERGTATWSIDLAGGQPRKLEGARRRPGASVVSPTGRQVVFIRRTDTGNRLVSMRPDGSRRRDLTPQIGRGASPENPDFSPDGRLIVFSAGSTPGLYTMGADGRRLKRLSDPGQGPRGYVDPAFSPNGREVVAVVRGHSGPSSLVRFEIGGDGSARGIPHVRYGDMPAWAPRP